MHCWIIRLVVLLLIVPLLIMGLIVFDGITDELQPVDVAIVFGNTVTPDGQPSERLRARLDRVIEIYRQLWAPNIVVSGGVGREGVDEAVVMQRYLIQRGIPSKRILVDSQGLTTHLTAHHAAELVRARRWRRAMVITQYFHIARAKLSLRQMGIPMVAGAHAKYFELRDVYATLREVLGLPAYFIRYGWR